MAGVKRISREEISDIKEADDPWKILVNPAQPSKRRKVTPTESTQPYVYEQNLDEFDSRLNFRYSVTLWGDLVDWKKKGKGPDKFKTFDKVDYSELVIQVGDIVYVNFGDPNEVRAGPVAEQKANPATTGDEENEDANGGESHISSVPNRNTQPEQDAIPDWVAKVLECRAFDEEHVFLRVLWLYRPEDLPGGRKPWHGWNEVFPSNHMQIIDAMTVTGMAGGLVKWSEKDKTTLLAPEDDSLVWRQTAKIQTQGGRIVPKILGKLTTYCKCQQPANPDGTLIECKACGNWMHDTCIEEGMAKAYTAQGAKPEAPNDDVEPTTPTKSEADGLGVADDEEKPVKSTHFNPITGAVKMITNQLKRAGTPRKATEISSRPQTLLEHIEKALDPLAVSSDVTYTASITGLDGDGEDEPLRVEIIERKVGETGPGRSVALQKIRCLFCEKEIE